MLQVTSAFKGHSTYFGPFEHVLFIQIMYVKNI